MGLLTKLKSLLGLEDDRSSVRRTESGVTIEREPDESAEPDADVERTAEGGDADAAESTTETTGVSGIEEAEETGADEAETEPDAAGAEVRESDAEETDAEAPADEGDAEADIATEDVTTAPEAESVEAERDEAAEPAEAVQPSTDAAEPDQSAGDEPEPTPEETGDDEPEPDAAADEPVGEGEPLEDVKGIGPAYAERLRDAGVADVTELAKADADQLADETGLSAKRISTWIERAEAR